jgi:hypothetical protein
MWYSTTSFTVDLNFTDANTHQLAVYFPHWQYFNKNEALDVLDVNGNVLTTQNVETFHSGVYLVWRLSGHVKMRITRLGGPVGLINRLIAQISSFLS